MSAVRNATRWARGLRSIMLSLLKPDAQPVPQLGNDPDDFVRCLNDDLLSVEDRDEVFFYAQAERLPSLTRYHQLRSWNDVSKEYAWATTHIGRKSHRHCQLHLDDWHDPAATRLKILARTGGLHWAEKRARWAGMEIHEGFCSACDRKEPENLSHAFFDCPQSLQARNSMLRRVRNALSRLPLGVAGPPLVAFEFMSREEKLLLYLGKRNESKRVDAIVDSAVKRFLKVANAKFREPQGMGVDL